MPNPEITQKVENIYRDHFMHAPSQLEMTLHCNVVFHWLVAYTKWSLHPSWKRSTHWSCIVTIMIADGLGTDRAMPCWIESFWKFNLIMNKLLNFPKLQRAWKLMLWAALCKKCVLKPEKKLDWLNIPSAILPDSKIVSQANIFV